MLTQVAYFELMDHWFLISQGRGGDPGKKSNLFKVIQQVIGRARSPGFCVLPQTPESSRDSHSLGQYTWKLLSLQLGVGGSVLTCSSRDTLLPTLMSEQVTHLLPLSPYPPTLLHPSTGEVRNKRSCG